jgi:hypothetical protein
MDVIELVEVGFLDLRKRGGMARAAVVDQIVEALDAPILLQRLADLEAAALRPNSWMAATAVAACARSE